MLYLTTRLTEHREEGCRQPCVERRHTEICLPCRIYGQACATYESASLRMFHLGRTDTIRSSSMDSLAFVKGMDDSTVLVRDLGHGWVGCAGTPRSFPVHSVQRTCTSMVFESYSGQRELNRRWSHEYSSELSGSESKTMCPSVHKRSQPAICPCTSAANAGLYRMKRWRLGTCCGAGCRASC